MPQTLEIQTFKFSELEGAARDKALEWGRTVCHDEYDGEMLTEMFEEQLIEKGYIFDDPQICWSLGCCQGDGVAFYGRLDLEKLAMKDKYVLHLLRKAARLIKIRYRNCPTEDIPQCDFTVDIASTSNHYHHWNTMGVTCAMDLDYDPKDCLEPYCAETLAGERVHWTKPFKDHPPKFYGLGDVSLEIEEHIQEQVKAISHELEKLGYDDIEFRTSDDEVIEFITANEYDFDEEGCRTVCL